MLRINQLRGFNAGTAAAETFAQTIAFSTYGQSTIDATTVTFAATTVGTASSDRLVVVSAHGVKGTTEPFTLSLNINSSPATAVVSTVNASNTFFTGVYQMPLPTSETAVDIALTWSTVSGHTGYSVWILKGLASQTVSTFGASQKASSVGVVTLNRPSGGVGVSGLTDPVNTTLHTWDSPFTMNFASSLEAGDTFTAAVLSPSGGGSVSARVNHASSASGGPMVAAIWS